MLRYTVTFTGAVQGVGFRYATANLAPRFNVAGWVRNESDGSVTCVIEGERAETDRFIAAIQNAMRSHISDTQIQSSPATGEFRDFSIAR
jgi:acylphosphatase